MRGLLTSVLIAAFTVSGLGQTIVASDASHHVGEKAVVCGQITGEHTATTSRGSPKFINLDRTYPHPVFTAVVWEENRAAVGALPSSGQICVTGAIVEYRGVPQIQSERPDLLQQGLRHLRIRRHRLSDRGTSFEYQHQEKH